MRFQLGILTCLLAGCATQPTSPVHSSRELPPDAVATGLLYRPVILRIGIEHLPPDAVSPAEQEPRVESQSTMAPAAPAARREEQRLRPDSAASRHTWSMSAADLAAIEDPIARETLHFVDDLLESDRQRVRREVGTPFFDGYDPDLEAGPRLASEEAMRSAQQEWLQQRGQSLLRRPLRQLFRRLSVVKQFEVDFEDFRGDHVPLTEPYGQTHRDRSSWGRVSVRVRANELDDPVEVAYVVSGVRVGTSQEDAKLSIDWDLADRLRLELRGRSEYQTHEQFWRADLAYRHSDTTSLHLSVGDDLDFLTTSSLYSLFETPMDGSAGVVLYAVHIF